MKKYSPLIASFVFVTVLVCAVEFVALKKTNHHFSYPLDDTFIHLVIAKNTALSGTWGINPDAYSATSSSPLFTALLALLIKLFSFTILLPLLLASLGTGLLIIAMHKELKRYSSLNYGGKTLVMIGALLLGTIPVLTLLGMEHTLQTALVLLFVHSVATLLSTGGSQKEMALAATWASLMTLARYESLFFLAGALGLLLLQKKWKSFLLILSAGLLPVFLFGLYSISKGGFFFPNSIMIKSNQNFVYLLNGGTTFIENTRSFSGLVVIALLIAFKKYLAQRLDRDFWVLCMFLLAATMHGVLISLSWFYRYESYLITIGSFQILKILIEWIQENKWAGLRRHVVPAAVLVLLLLSLPIRGLNSLRNSVRGLTNIYEQQTQMGFFLQKYYSGQTVAANDVGAISYYGNIHTLDLWGLGNNEVMKARKNKTWGSGYLQKLVQDNNTRVAVIYDSWFDSSLTTAWKKVATWEISNNFSCGDSKVSFYAVDSAQANTLMNNLKTFNAQLPNTVKVVYY
jgi:hypothetical protein